MQISSYFSCTRITRWTIGISRPSILNTTISPTLIGEVPIVRNKISPRLKLGSMLPLPLGEAFVKKNVFVFYFGERLPENHHDGALTRGDNHKRLPNHQSRCHNQSQIDNLVCKLKAIYSSVLREFWRGFEKKNLTLPHFSKSIVHFSKPVHG